MAYESRLAIKSAEEAQRVARLLADGRITGEGRTRALADLRTFDRQQRNLANIRKDQAGYDPTSGMSGGQKFLAGIGSGMTDVGLGAQQLVGLKSGEDAARKRETDAALLRTGAGMAGNIAGQIAATAPAGALGAAGRGASVLKLARAGATQGAATGGLLPAADAPERLRNVGTGAAFGAAIPAGIGMAGRIASRTPQLDRMGQAMQRLQDQGIALTRADTLTHPAARSVARLGQDTLTGQVARRTGEARRNSTIARAVLRHIGEEADEATPEVLNRARLRIGREFESVYSPDTVVRMTPDLIQTRAGVLKNLPHVAGSKQAVLDELGRIRGAFRNGRTTGRTVKELTAHLKRRAESARKGQAMDAADAYDDLIEGLEEAAFDAAGPDARKRIAVARRQWRNLRAIEKAADRDWGGGISPRKLAGYMSRNKYTRNAYQRPDDGSLELLARDLDSVADKFPNSGTPGRTLPVGELGAASLAPATGGGSLALPAANFAAQKLLAGKAGRVGSPRVLRRALAKLESAPKAGQVANMAALVPLIQQFQQDPDGVRALLGLPPDKAVTMEELEAMFGGPK